MLDTCVQDHPATFATAGSPTNTSRRIHPDHVRRTPISVVVPCFNEADSIPKLLSKLDIFQQSAAACYECHFLLVDDGSTDNTGALLEAAAATRDNLTVLSHRQNQGIAAAIATGIRHAETEIVCSIDSDCTYDPLLLNWMIPKLTDDVSMVVASPYHTDGSVCGAPAWRIALSRLASQAYRTLMRNKLSCYTSCFRVYRRSHAAAVQQQQAGFVGVVELLWRLDRQGARIVETPARLTSRTTGVSKMRIMRTITGHSRFLCRIFTIRVGDLFFKGSPHIKLMQPATMEKTLL